MKKFALVLAATALLPLAACNRTPTEQAADNLSDNLEMQADNLQAASENAADAGMTNTADALKNASEATENRADAVETNVENTSM